MVFHNLYYLVLFQLKQIPQIFQLMHIHTELEQDIAKTICQPFYHNAYEKLDSNQKFSYCEKYGFCLAELATIQKLI